MRRLPTSRLAPSAIVLLALAVAAPAAHATEIQRSFDAGPGGLLVMRAEGTKIEIVSGGNEVTLDLQRVGTSTKPIEDDYELDFSQQGDEVRLVIDRRRKISLGWRDRGLRATVTVPARFDARIDSAGGSVEVADLQGDLEIETAGGSIRVGAIDGTVDLESAGGSIEVRAVSGDATLESSGGSIRIDRADAAVVATTAGGSISVEEIAGPLRASTSGGGVRASLTETPGSDSELTTAGGSIEVALAGNVGVDIDARASGGSVRSSVDVDVVEKSKSRLVGSVGGGGPRMVLRSSGGSVRIVGG